MEGLIALMSTMVHPNAFLCSFSILSNFSSCNPIKNEEIITGNLSHFYKKIHTLNEKARVYDLELVAPQLMVLV